MVQCRGSKARSPASGSTWVNEPPRGPWGSKSSPDKEQVGEAAGSAFRGSALHPPGTPPGWLAGSPSAFLRGRGPCSGLHQEPTAQEDGGCPGWAWGGQGSPAVDTFPTVLGPCQLQLPNLCSPGKRQAGIFVNFSKPLYFYCWLCGPDPSGTGLRLLTYQLTTCSALLPGQGQRLCGRGRRL